ncbi:MAG TPA: hypothetical protein VF710_09615 [Longimicrobium sp.]|jgi:hypothetical protein
MLKKRMHVEVPDLTDVSPDLRGLIERLAEKGITAWPSKVKPGDPLPEPLRLNTSLSDAIIEERDEYGR